MGIDGVELCNCLQSRQGVGSLCSALLTIIESKLPFKAEAYLGQNNSFVPRALAGRGLRSDSCQYSQHPGEYEQLSPKGGLWAEYPYNAQFECVYMNCTARAILCHSPPGPLHFSTSFILLGTCDWFLLLPLGACIIHTIWPACLAFLCSLDFPGYNSWFWFLNPLASLHVLSSWETLWSLANMAGIDK